MAWAPMRKKRWLIAYWCQISTILWFSSLITITVKTNPWDKTESTSLLVNLSQKSWQLQITSKMVAQSNHPLKSLRLVTWIWTTLANSPDQVSPAIILRWPSRIRRQWWGRHLSMTTRRRQRCRARELLMSGCRYLRGLKRMPMRAPRMTMKVSSIEREAQTQSQSTVAMTCQLKARSASVSPKSSLLMTHHSISSQSNACLKSTLKTFKLIQLRTAWSV